MTATTSDERPVQAKVVVLTPQTRPSTHTITSRALPENTRAQSCLRSTSSQTRGRGHRLSKHVQGCRLELQAAASAQLTSRAVAGSLDLSRDSRRRLGWARRRMFARQVQPRHARLSSLEEVEVMGLATAWAVVSRNRLDLVLVLHGVP